MRLKRIILAFFALFCIASVIPASATAASAADDGIWRYYSAFYNNPRRIMDSKRYTYFLVYQQKYDVAAGNYNQLALPAGTIFYYDKEQPSEGIRPLTDRARLNGANITVADCNARTGTLVICYENGDIDITDASGNVTHIDEISRRFNAKSSAVKSISFDLDNNIWLGLANGYLLIDGSDYSVTDTADFEIEVTSICRVGSQIVASMHSRVYAAPAGADIHTAAAFKAVDTSNSYPYSFMPLDGTSFAAVASLNNVAWPYIYLYRYDGSKWTRTTAIDTTKEPNLSNNSTNNLPIRALANNTWCASRFENNALTTRDGYLLFNRDYCYQIERGLDENGALRFQKRRNSPSAIDCATLGSYDFETLWFYQDPATFASAKASGYGKEAVWTAASSVKPEGPMAFRRVLFDYSPTRGLVMTQHGRTHTYNITQNFGPLTCVLKNGVWSSVSPVTHRPDFASQDPYKSKYNSQYPAKDPTSITVDPLFPDYLFTGSFTDGFYALHMSDLSGATLRWTSPDNQFSSMPNSTNFLPIPIHWKGVVPVHSVGYDADNTLWLFYNTVWEANGEVCEFYGLSAEARRNMLEKQDISLCGDFYRVPFKAVSYGEATALALRHPNNKNKLIAHTSADWSVTIVDHNGTYDTTADDISTQFQYVRTPAGGHLFAGEVNKILEDPVTGNVYLACKNGLMCLDPNDKLVNGAFPAAPLTLTGPDGKTTCVGEATNVLDISIDKYNRLWICTLADGVIGVDADRSNVIAHYRTENSGLPSNHTFAAFLNPDDDRLYISSQGGLASVDPGRVASRDARLALRAFPSEITADFAGTVAVYNISGTAEVKVKNSRDKIVATLPAPADNISHWNLLDSDGNAVPTGKYTIFDASGNLLPIEISVIR